MKTHQDLQNELRSLADEELAVHSARYFQTQKGGYAEGDRFLGIRMPNLRQVIKKYRLLSLEDTESLMKSVYHEERMAGVLILVEQYKAARSDEERERIYRAYISRFERINNWDLVDVSCPKIVGKHLMSRDRGILYQWAGSGHLWTRRVSVICNLWLVSQGDLKEVFPLARLLLSDPHDLIHKAVGWVLREAWKRDSEKTESFLKEHYQAMPRTMLRYAIEKMPEARRKAYLEGTFESQ
ncbi:MAG: DNA alkylation repair protein [Deltaproteobacteria bacterium]|nr:DNA alkylation repair protein [Deltaproteobacteria bacterium]